MQKRNNRHPVPAPETPVTRRKTRRQVAEELSRSRKTNSEMAQHSPVFQKACELSGVEPTARQFGKFVKRGGLAWQHRREALESLAEEQSDE